MTSCVNGGASSGGASGASARELGPSKTMSEAAFFAFDTVVSIKAFCTEALMDAVVARCGRFEELFSARTEGSDVWNINHAQGERTTVSEETARAIESSLRYSRETNGLFDVTIGAVSLLWDFHEGVKPSDELLQEACAHVDYRLIAIEGNTVKLDDPQARIDLGGIAKGYIADDLVGMFRQYGVESALVNLGGNVFALGSKGEGQAWKVGIQDPNEKLGESDEDSSEPHRIIASRLCEDCSVVTSGLYERQFVQDGVRYHHILDPRTGYPVQSDLMSVSIASSSSIDGDAYVTSLFLMGTHEATKFVTDRPELDVLLCNASGTVETSPQTDYVMA